MDDATRDTHALARYKARHGCLPNGSVWRVQVMDSTGQSIEFTSQIMASTSELALVKVERAHPGRVLKLLGLVRSPPRSAPP